MNAYMQGYMSKEASSIGYRQDLRRRRAREQDMSRLEQVSRPRRQYTYNNVNDVGSSSNRNPLYPTSPTLSNRTREYNRSSFWSKSPEDRRAELDRYREHFIKNSPLHPGHEDFRGTDLGIRESIRRSQKGLPRRFDTIDQLYRDRSALYTGGLVRSNRDATRLVDHVMANPDYNWRQHVSPTDHNRFEEGLKRRQESVYRDNPAYRSLDEIQGEAVEEPISSPYNPDEQQTLRSIDSHIQEELDSRTHLPEPSTDEGREYRDHVHQEIDAANERIAESRRQAEESHRRHQEQRRQIEEQDRRIAQQRAETERLLGRSF